MDVWYTRDDCNFKELLFSNASEALLNGKGRFLELSRITTSLSNKGKRRRLEDIKQYLLRYLAFVKGYTLNLKIHGTRGLLVASERARLKRFQ